MKAILLIHGFLTDQNDFLPIMTDLRKRYNYIKSFNLPGHNGGKKWKEFTVDDTINMVVNYFDELALMYDEIDVMGFSMGGALAVYLSNVRQFNKLILLSPANKYFNFNLPIQKVSFYFKTLIEKNKKRKINEKELVEIEKYKNIRLDNMKSTKIAFQKLIPNYNFHTLSTFVKVINRCNKGTKTIVNPTLIVWGKMDQLVPKKAVDFAYELCCHENKKIVIFDDISHLMLKSTRVEKIKKEIIDFIDN